jgi:hypothetical protein
MIPNTVTARRDQRTQHAEVLKSDVTNRQTGFGHRATISSNMIRSESPIFPIMFL